MQDGGKGANYNMPKDERSPDNPSGTNPIPTNSSDEDSSDEEAPTPGLSCVFFFLCHFVFSHYNATCVVFFSFERLIALAQTR